MSETTVEPVFRVLPTLDEPSAFFWTSGADGTLRFLRCADCSYLIHPPAPFCPQCQSRDTAPTEVSGRGTVHSFTVNHQPWDGVGDVYVLGLVEIDEQPDVRLTTNIVGVDPDDVRIGMPVEVVFEDHAPVFIPLFRPSRPRAQRRCLGLCAARAAERGPSGPARGPRADKSVISGIGQSQIGRKLGRDELDLTIEAALVAIADAGLTVADIDGLAAYPGGVMGDSSGFAGPGTPAVQDALRLSLNWHSGGIEGPAQIQAVINAVTAVSMGLARHVLVYRTVTESTAQGSGSRAGIGVGHRGHRRRDAVVDPVPRVLRGQLARDERATPLLRVRHDARADGTDRAQRASQRGPQPQRDLPRPDVDGRLLRRAHDHHAVLPVRLRHPGRRLHGGHRVGRRARRRGRPSGGARRGGRHRAAGPALVGPVRRHDHDAGARCRCAHVVAYRSPARRRGRGRALRRLQLARDGLARGTRLLRARRERAVHRGGQADRARRRCPAEHARWPAECGATARIRVFARGCRPAPR